MTLIEFEKLKNPPSCKCEGQGNNTKKKNTHPHTNRGRGMWLSSSLSSCCCLVTVVVIPAVWSPLSLPPFHPMSWGYCKSHCSQPCPLCLPIFEVFTLPHLSYWTPLGVQVYYWDWLGLHWDSTRTGSSANSCKLFTHSPSPIQVESQWSPSGIWVVLRIPRTVPVHSTGSVQTNSPLAV